ncbi:hypothetical protein [Methylibium sp. Root1272]|uniref:DinB/UmuC family translesion DNA polymerase n=1 Tax=Methylibium sp. Root1272 TaxID=1736441 RepID=UPI0006F29988|nr:hypothetical protein [Methylibium sp. Root1272]KQW70078.1 hypothetical protein ASC67_06270 [Methylibium sp. Root1272]
MLERTVRELQGVSCIGFEDEPPAKQEIACTRSFGQPIREQPPLIEAVTLFASRAAEKLRGQQGHAGKVLVFTHTSPHRPGPQYGKNIVLPLRRPTSNTADLVAAAVRRIRQIYRPGYELIKAGVMLLDLQPASRRAGTSMNWRSTNRPRTPCG